MKVRDLRPLDPLRSIKVKIGVLVAASIAASSLAFWYALGWVPPGTFLTAVVIGLLVTQLLAHGMTSPLREMTAAAKAMAQGDYSRRVRATSRDEVGELARAFNQMAADLEAVDRQRRELIANVSHELRTPISAMQAVLENLVDGVSQPDPQTLRAALAQTERLGALVKDLLDLSRLDAGVVPLDPERFEVKPWLSAAIREATAGRDAHIDVVVTPDDLTVLADPARLHQVVTNLVDNAIRHGPPGGRITVSARATPEGGMRLDVADEGPGIPAELRPRVFERFIGSNARSRDGSTGLGLAIARWVVELHGGSIAVAPGPVSRIQVTVPAVPPPPKVPPPDVVVREMSRNEGAEMNVTTPPATPPYGPVAGPPMYPLIPPPRRGKGPEWRFWPDVRSGAPGAVFGFALLAGLVTAWTEPYAVIGLGGLLTGLVAAGALIAVVATSRAARWRLVRPLPLAAGAATLLLLAVGIFRAAEWLNVLCVMTALGLASYGLVGGRRWSTVLFGWFAPQVGVFRGIPWLFRGLRNTRSSQALRWLLVVVVTGVLLLIFGALFASADAAFGRVIDRLVPDISLIELIPRTFFAVVVIGLVLGAAFVARVPPRLDRLTLRVRRRLRRAEWLVPLTALVLLFTGFVAVQIGVLFGGHDHVLRTAGLTYAEYARQGFAQLVLVTMLTLGVLAIVARWAPRETPTDRTLLRLVPGALCALTLVIVASALYRLHLYQEAYGFTVLRLWGNAFELWLGVVFVLIMIAGVRLRGDWLPRAVVATAAVAMLALAALNPDRFIAEQNIARWEATGKLDVEYLYTLSEDAAPVLDRLPEPYRSCALTQIYDRLQEPDPWYGFNLGRVQAREVLDARPITPDDECRLHPME